MANWCCVVVVRSLPFNPLQDMKRTLLTLTISSLLATTAFADPIHRAAARGDLAGVQAELDKGVDVNAKDGDGNEFGTKGGTPLHWVATKEIAELLIAEGADEKAKDENGGTPLHWAAWGGYKEVAELLIERGADVNAQIVEWDKTIPLHYAAMRGHKEIAELLIAKGADVNTKDNAGRTPLYRAIWDGHKEVVELLLASGADVNAKTDAGETPLTNATNNGHTEIVDLLRKHGGMTGDELASGMTPLHAAASKGLKEVVELLIANGADVNAKDRVGETPLDFAINKNRTETADLLREYGGKTGEELNALLDAAKKGDIEAVKQHLAAGADVNAKTADGTTPLHNAAVYGHTEVAELLIANGANMNAIIVSGRNQGKTPLDLAIWRKKNEAAALLRKHGGRTAEELALMPRLVQHGRFAFSFDAKEGKVYEVQDSFDLLNWEVIKIYTGTGSSVRFDEERDHDPPKIFYRVKVVE